ncbi:MAG: carbohydrate-binding domain-containing protein [Oscillospiraceae bacterium]|nr:carbohydrate-binding domain-containing protein [Oscillospiraceae bacterium]
MKKILSLFLTLAVMVSVFTACGPSQTSEGAEVTYTGITLSDNGVLVGGDEAATDPSSAVYVSSDIVFYLEGQGAEYGEGESGEEHPQSEADKHTVINITKPGNYMISGSISHGQIAVNLGDDAKKNPDAVVNITLNNADITCTVAPAIICYSAYECGSDDTDTATKDVDISAAGFNITIADGSINNINGSHVARIYKPGTTDKLHKYDAAIESLVSLNINGDDGVLNLVADNEGIETKLHMTINGGEININSADDALNAGEDYVSVITINDGKILANSNNGAEGDGIDSNGWLVINGGYVSAFGNSHSQDSGLDSDNGIHINGGTVFATGNMYDEISSESTQNSVVFSFAQPVSPDKYILLRSSRGMDATAFNGTASGSVMVYSSPLLTEDDYTLYTAQSVTGEGVNGIYSDITEVVDEKQLAHSGGNAMGLGKGGAMMAKPDDKGFTDGDRPQIPDRGEMPEDMREFTPPQDFKDKMPQWDITPDENGRPIGFGGEGGFDFKNNPQYSFGTATETVFAIKSGNNMFSGIAEYASE